MHWILTQPTDPKMAELHGLLMRTGTPHTLVRGGPAPGTIAPDVSPAGPVICMGSPGLARVAREKGWSPGAPDARWLGYRECIDTWGDRMLNADAVFATFGELEAAAASVGKARVFLRPAYDTKSFDATLVDADGIAAWKTDVAPRPADDVPAMTCAPKRVLAEWRTWIVAGEVATASLYRRGGRALFDGRDVPDEVTAFAASAARTLEEGDRTPPQAYVLDVALVEGGLRIVEVNGIVGARLYDCDVSRLFGALSGLSPQETPAPGMPG